VFIAGATVSRSLYFSATSKSQLIDCQHQGAGAGHDQMPDQYSPKVQNWVSANAKDVKLPVLEHGRLLMKPSSGWNVLCVACLKYPNQPRIIGIRSSMMLMDLPVVPRHDTCPLPVKLMVMDADFEEAQPKPNPFAALAGLKIPGKPSR
jgi:hypothetical protein